jgi:FixJ family two-component response regulator
MSTGEDDTAVVIVDDDPSIRAALGSLFRSVGINAKVFDSVPAYLAAVASLADCPTCLVLDVRLSGIGGLELQKQLTQSGSKVPIIFMTAHGDIPMSVRAMKDGAVDFLAKPFRDQDMLDAVTKALEIDRTRRSNYAHVAAARVRYDTLTDREKQVMAQVALGFLNKQIASQLSVSEITIKIHRGRLMKKLGATCLADLVKFAKSIEQSD